MKFFEIQCNEIHLVAKDVLPTLQEIIYSFIYSFFKIELYLTLP